MIRRVVIWGLILLVALSAVAYWGANRWFQQQLQAATDLLKKGEFGPARVSARSAMQVAFTRENQDQAKLVLARATLSDESLGEPILEEAFQWLEEISPSSSVYPDAVTDRSRLMLLSKVEVRAAERLVNEAIRQSPDHLAANQLLFTIYCLTNRPERADPVFWVGFRQIPTEEKPAAFRQWFLSQFTRNGANRAFDVGTGIVPPNREPSDDDIIKRFIAFKDSEPNEATHYGAMASWWLWRTETKTALEILQIGQERASSVAEEVYLSSLIQALLNQGSLDQAKELLDQWPESERGFNYWRHLGVYQESVNERQLAVETYKKCLEIWPGPIDANIRHRLGQCLKELGRSDEAAKVASQTEIARSWLEDRWGLVRKAVDYLHDEQAVGVLLEFFTAIGKPEAVEFLTQYHSELKAKK
jgi:tetratricopeptide (TPR) repeat protein